MEVRVDCEGAPRDLGLDQGRAIGEGVDAELVRILRERPVGAAMKELGRDVQRYFPHLAERMAGLAHGASVARTALVVALARAAAEPEFLFRPGRAAAALVSGAMVESAPGVASPCLAARFDLSADRCSVPIVRRSEPQGGFASLELTLPWLAASLGGVNAAGLAAVLAPPTGVIDARTSVVAEATCRAPARLLLLQCLERFERVDTAVDWCLSRPAGGRASILLADAQGALASVELDEDRRHSVSPSLVPELAGGVASLPAFFGDGENAGTGVRALAHAAYLWLDPAARSLHLILDREGLTPEASVESFDLEVGS